MIICSIKTRLSRLAEQQYDGILIYTTDLYLCTLPLCTQTSFIVSNVSSSKSILKVITVLFCIIFSRRGSTVATAILPLQMSHFFVHRKPERVLTF